MKLWFEDDIFVAFACEWIETDPDDAVVQADPEDKLDTDELSVDEAEDDDVIPSSDPCYIQVYRS